MNKKVVLIVGVAVAALAAFLVLRGQPAGGVQEIKIGFAGTLSGPASFVGTEIKRGAEIAVDEINAKGGVGGRKLRLVPRDDEHQPSKTVAIYRELVEREKVACMLGAANSASMLAVAPIVNDSLQVPVICPATDATDITENDAKRQGKLNFMFRVGMYGFGQANFMVDTAVKKLKYSKIGLLTWSGGWGVTGRGELRRRLKELGLTAVADETYGESDTDMTAQISKLRDAGAQCILNYGLVKDNNAVMKTRQLLRDETPYISAWGLAGPAFWTAAGTAAEGVCVTTTVTMDGPQSSERTAFAESYRARFGEFVAPVFAVGSYDAVYLFKIAMEKRGVAATAIRDGLEDIQEFRGLIKHFTRPVFTSERHNAVTEDDMVLTRWTSGKLLEMRSDDGGFYVQTDPSTKRPVDLASMRLK